LFQCFKRGNDLVKIIFNDFRQARQQSIAQNQNRLARSPAFQSDCLVNRVDCKKINLTFDNFRNFQNSMTVRIGFDHAGKFCFRLQQFADLGNVVIEV